MTRDEMAAAYALLLDDTPATVEWLEQVGVPYGYDDDGHRLWFNAERGEVLLHIRFDVEYGYSAYRAGPTRGQVHLAALLVGVELQEPTKEVK